MNTTAEVYLWGTRVGIIHEPIDRNYASFEYDEKFLKSKIELSPIRMPLNNTVYEFPSLAGDIFHGLPGLVSDSLPDKFGNAVIEKWLVSQGKNFSDFTAIDRLCYIGKRGMGALEYVPAIYRGDEIDELINVNKMVELASQILNRREEVSFNIKDDISYAQLMQVGTSAGGARAKALIAWNKKTNEIKSGQLILDKDFDYWLMKFDNVKNNGDHETIDIAKYNLIEYAYYLMALSSGIIMNECKILHLDGANHFMTKRFDRVDGKKIHMQTLGGLAHISYNEPNLCSYEQAALYMRNINLTQKEIEQFYRRMVFNCIAINQDDHVKNTSFLMNKSGEWTLSPAYDITFSYNIDNKWLKAHQMSINGKINHIGYNDLVMAGENMNIKTKHCKEIIFEVVDKVRHFSDYANEAGLSEKTMGFIKNMIDKNIMDGDFIKGNLK